MRIFEVVMGTYEYQMQIIVFAKDEAEIMHKYCGIISITEVIIH